MASLGEQVDLVETPALSRAVAYIKLLQIGSIGSFHACAMKVGGAAFVTGRLGSNKPPSSRHMWPG